jgi:hypothetical protein
VQQRQAAGAQLIAEARAQVAAINGETALGGVQRLEKERDVWVQTLTGDRLTGTQRLEVARTINQEIASIAKEQQAQAQAIARSDADTDIAIARLSLAAEKQVLEDKLQANQASGSQKLAILREFSAQEFSLNLQALNSELTTLNSQPVEYERVYNQIRELKAKLTLELATLDRQGSADAAREAKDQVTQWKTAVGEIEGAESGLVADLLNKRKSLSQSLLSIGSEMLTKEIANDLKAFTTKMLLQDSTKALEQGGYGYHAIVELMKTQATTTGEAARTGAAVSGDAARLSSQASAATAGKAISKATGQSTVLADAAKAYSGTYASVAQIPYVGWALAPVAAGTAYAAVAAYEGLASLDVGTNYVPHDMVANIHQGEAVVPKAYNPAAGSINGATGQGAQQGGDTHNYGDIHTSDTSLKRMLSSRGNQRAVMDTFAAAYRRGAR